MATASERIIIARTDSIGDVVLTLPMCGWIKKHLPESQIIFIGRTYTKPVANACIHIDHFVDWDEVSKLSPIKQIELLQQLNASVIIHVFPRKEIMWVAKRAKIPIRVATGHRLAAINKNNKLVFFSRKKSDKHEAQLNMQLLKPLGIDAEVSLDAIKELYGLSRISHLKPEFSSLIDDSKINLILHPKSKGSAVEWGLQNFSRLIELIPKDKVKIFVTGTKEEGESINQVLNLDELPVIDLTGKLSLEEMIAFIARCDTMVAASTGPLHIASALGKKAIGLFSPKRPIHPGRWMPVGQHSKTLVAAVHPLKGSSLSIPPEAVLEQILL